MQVSHDSQDSAPDAAQSNICSSVKPSTLSIVSQLAKIEKLNMPTINKRIELNVLFVSDFIDSMTDVSKSSAQEFLDNSRNIQGSFRESALETIYLMQSAYVNLFPGENFEEAYRNHCIKKVSAFCKTSDDADKIKTAILSEPRTLISERSFMKVIENPKYHRHVDVEKVAFQDGIYYRVFDVLTRETLTM